MIRTGTLCRTVSPGKFAGGRVRDILVLPAVKRSNGTYHSIGEPLRANVGEAVLVLSTTSPTWPLCLLGDQLVFIENEALEEI